ncbi:hypothetical protein H257_17854 [Aphanomyces astaci]|uniref:Uncharacterized protein n=1 Tax=Aphanomyces astaci TaxID=112090 RepID=W4FF80_APHAT|nr:hypothetical protein H257_17854 [Aphanomyces astaci]ETV65393.1 hypothetical protein H257_17854 [Aphanomyces astaci]|eukprot:XP_009845108.1 hypothetical protein H257_17854 [Aphanomyces astaci]
MTPTTPNNSMPALWKHSNLTLERHPIRTTSGNKRGQGTWRIQRLSLLSPGTNTTIVQLENILRRESLENEAYIRDPGTPSPLNCLIDSLELTTWFHTSALDFLIIADCDLPAHKATQLWTPTPSGSLTPHLKSISTYCHDTPAAHRDETDKECTDKGISFQQWIQRIGLSSTFRYRYPNLQRHNYTRNNIAVALYDNYIIACFAHKLDLCPGIHKPIRVVNACTLTKEDISTFGAHASKLLLDGQLPRFRPPHTCRRDMDTTDRLEGAF